MGVTGWTAGGGADAKKQNDHRLCLSHTNLARRLQWTMFNCWQMSQQFAGQTMYDDNTNVIVKSL